MTYDASGRGEGWGRYLEAARPEPCGPPCTRACNIKLNFQNLLDRQIEDTKDL